MYPDTRVYVFACSCLGPGLRLSNDTCDPCSPRSAHAPASRRTRALPGYESTSSSLRVDRSVTCLSCARSVGRGTQQRGWVAHISGTWLAFSQRASSPNPRHALAAPASRPRRARADPARHAASARSDAPCPPPLTRIDSPVACAATRTDSKASTAPTTRRRPSTRAPAPRARR